MASVRVAQSGAIAAINECSELAQHDLFSAAGGRSAVAVPVLVGGALWGALGVMLREPDVPTAAVAQLERLAELISAGLANAQAQTRLGHEARLDRALREIAVASAAGELSEPELAGLVAPRKEFPRKVAKARFCLRIATDGYGAAFVRGFAWRSNTT